MIKLLTKPIVVCILLFVITWVTLYYKESKRIKKDTVAKRESISLFIPAVVAVIGYAIAYKCDGMFNTSEDPVVQNGGGDSINISDVAREQLVGKGDIRLPQPDIFLELANF